MCSSVFLLKAKFDFNIRCIEFVCKYSFEKHKLFSLHSLAGVNCRLKIVLGVIVRTRDNFSSSKSCFHIRILRLKNYDLILSTCLRE